MADVKRQRLLTEAAGRVPSQDHTLERHLTLTPPTSGSVASRFMTEKSAFGVFGGASGRRNGRYTGSGRDARDILRSSAMRGKCRDERDEGNNNGTARMLVFECRPPGGAAGYVRGGCSQAARLTFPSIASVCLRGGGWPVVLGTSRNKGPFAAATTPATLRAAHRRQHRRALAPASVCTVVREHGNREPVQRVAVAASGEYGHAAVSGCTRVRRTGRCAILGRPGAYQFDE
jgi:hypothetical protein